MHIKQQPQHIYYSSFCDDELAKQQCHGLNQQGFILIQLSSFQHWPYERQNFENSASSYHLSIHRPDRPYLTDRWPMLLLPS